MANLVFCAYESVTSLPVPARGRSLLVCVDHSTALRPEKNQGNRGVQRRVASLTLGYAGV